jgi:sterol desaturase/sphingolipid hydroxylase (fatty acid hydroxylase superfamily)
MRAWLIDNAATLYGGAYFLTLAAVALWEEAAPRRRLSTPLLRRWLRNAALLILGTAAVRLLVPVSGVALALALEARGWGALNMAGLPAPVAFVVAILALDLSRYALHYAFHRVPVLWRLHAIHHSDPDYDFTTALRFHPGEALVFAGPALGVLIVLGPPAAAVALYEAINVAASVASHANAGFGRADAVLRRVYVTPDMHRVHHSADAAESNSNFGSILPWWDRFFGTYRAAPRLGHDDMAVGLEAFGDPRGLTLWSLIIHPFVRRSAPAETSNAPRGAAG